MMTLVIGGSGSGKSAYAEQYVQSISDGLDKYYLATMQVFGDEGKRKVERHRNMRKDKGFTTVEQPDSIANVLKRISCPERSAALLECISNLTANEMFTDKGTTKAQETVRRVVSDVAVLQKQIRHLVIVTNNVFEDGNLYDESTMEYIQAMGLINRTLAEMADEVMELVVGIPVIIKKGR
ncbi:MAG: bifunctional adenosylcobinamide kinase/adenosylcobinamide-phosphate guanylyltransferase [Brotaphodocola sp.]